MHLSSELSTALTERSDPMTERFVEQMRKDFLTLMRNLKRVDSFEKAEKLRHGIFTWEKRMQEWMGQVKEDLQDRSRDRWAAANSADAQALLRRIGIPFEFLGDVKQFPLQLSKKIYNYRTQKHEPAPRDMIWKEYQKEVKRWESRTRRKARAAWKWLKEAARWMSSTRGGREALVLKSATPENHRIEGFRVQLVGADAATPEEVRDTLAKLRESLRRYKRRAQRVLPMLLRKQLPLKVYVGDVGRQGNAGASYNRDHIQIHHSLVYEDVGRFVKTLAHEMGHHLYRAILSREATRAWTSLLRGTNYQMDLRDVLAKAKPGESSLDFMDRLQTQDPEMHLRVRGLFYSPKRDLHTLEGIRDHLERGGDPKVLVRRHPITAYANKNEEEAFCEVIGLLVAYGPRTIHPEVRSWFRRFVPQIRVESMADEIAAALV